MIPYAKVQPAHLMKCSCRVKVESESHAAAVSDPALQGGPAMDAAALVIQIDANAVRFVCDHQCTVDVRMWLRLIVCRLVFWLESDGIALATECTAVAGHLSHGELLGHLRFHSGIDRVPVMCLRLTLT